MAFLLMVTARRCGVPMVIAEAYGTAEASDAQNGQISVLIHQLPLTVPSSFLIRRQDRCGVKQAELGGRPSHGSQHSCASHVRAGA